MPASPPAPLIHQHPRENGSFMPASTPTFIECPSNSLYIYLDYVTISTLLYFHASYPPTTHPGTSMPGLPLPLLCFTSPGVASTYNGRSSDRFLRRIT